MTGENLFKDDGHLIMQDAIKRGKEIVQYRLVHPELLLPPVWYLHPMRTELEKLINLLRGIGQRLINEYKEKRVLEGGKGYYQPPDTDEEEENKIGIKAFRSIAEELIYAGASDKEILDEVATFAIAGHETTAGAIGMLLFHLASNQEHQKRCRDEIDQLMNSVGGKNEMNYNLTMDDLVSLKYLERCVQEGLRLTAIAPLFLRQIESPIEVADDLTIEGGTTVLISPWVIHRDPKNFPDPTKFDPDRFLPENVKDRHPGSYLPFSAGNRNCIGFKYAVIEVKTILGLILRHFEIYTTDKPEDINYFMEVTLLPDREINIILKNRTSKS